MGQLATIIYFPNYRPDFLSYSQVVANQHFLKFSLVCLLDVKYKGRFYTWKKGEVGRFLLPLSWPENTSMCLVDLKTSLLSIQPAHIFLHVPCQFLTHFRLFLRQQNTRKDEDATSDSCSKFIKAGNPRKVLLQVRKYRFVQKNVFSSTAISAVKGGLCPFWCIVRK